MPALDVRQKDMKIIPLLIAASLALSAAYADQARLDEAQVINMAKIIVKRSKSDLGFGFNLDKPRYSEKDGIWSFSPNLPPTTVGGYFLDIRDRDQYFRVGWIGSTGERPKGSYEFRLPPDIKRKFKKILDVRPK